MDKAMRRYYEEMSGKIEAAKDMAELRAYHAQRIREFQHERLIHLLVMFFFGGLTLIFIGVFVWILTFGIMLLTVLGGLLATIVLVTELFYVGYYYRLENGVQKLYQLTDKLYK